MTLATLATFFGWAALINSALLVLAFLISTLGRSRIIPLHSRLFRVSENELPRSIYLTFLGQYKLLIIQFNLVPYTVLVIMGR